MTIQPASKALLRTLAMWVVPLLGIYILLQVALPTGRHDASPPAPSPTPARNAAAAQAAKTEAPATPEAPAKELAVDPERAKEAEAKRLAEKWEYRVDEDPMTSRKSRYATIQSENTVDFGFPYSGAQHGTLMLRDHPTHGRDVMFSIERGQLQCRSYEDCSLRVRFDNGEPQRWSAVGPADNSSTLIFLRSEKAFVQKFRDAKVVRIQVPVYQEGAPIFEFHVSGFDNTKYTRGN